MSNRIKHRKITEHQRTIMFVYDDIARTVYNDVQIEYPDLSINSVTIIVYRFCVDFGRDAL